MDMHWQLAIAGALVGVCVGLSGMGGGALLTPILVLFFGVDPTKAVGSDLLVSFLYKPVGAAVHQRAGTVRWELVRWILPTAVPAGFAGAFVIHLFGDGALLQHRVKLAIGAALITAVIGIVARVIMNRMRDDSIEGMKPGERIPVRPIPTLLIGLFGGFIVGLTSVGSGSLIIVFLMMLYPRLRVNDLVGTDLVQAIPLTGAAALGHFIAGDVRIGLAAALLVGAIPGIYAGAKLSTTVPSHILRWCIAVLLLASGLQLWGLAISSTCVICVAFVAVVVASEMASSRFPALGSRPSS